ncbi:MAG: hypothetical protein AAF492_20290, partial [Verrucomicrobiota bacterium]
MSYGQASWPLLPEREKTHLVQALDLMNMTPDDMTFRKDVGKPTFTLSYVTNLLAEPMQLPGFAEQVYDDLSRGPAGIWSRAYRLLEVEGLETVGLFVAKQSFAAAPEPLRKPLADWYRAAVQVYDEVEKIVALLSEEEKQSLTASYLNGIFTLEDNEPLRRLMVEAGISSEALDRAEAEKLDLDPEPAAMKKLDAIQ